MSIRSLIQKESDNGIEINKEKNDISGVDDFEEYMIKNKDSFERLAESDLPISFFCEKCLEAVD